jgi:hypothetical protein
MEIFQQLTKTIHMANRKIFICPGLIDLVGGFGG